MREEEAVVMMRSELTWDTFQSYGQRSMLIDRMRGMKEKEDSR